MMNFTSLFNQWRGQNNSGVLDLLSKPDVSMGKLLDEDSFQTEYKSGNPKIAEFMKYSRYQELVQFVTVIGPPEDKKRSYKFPLSACEILTIDNTAALDFFLPEKTLTIDITTSHTEEVQVEVEVELEEYEAEKEENQQNPTEGETTQGGIKTVDTTQVKEEPKIEQLKQNTQSQIKPQLAQTPQISQSPAVICQPTEESSKQQKKDVQVQTPKKKTKKIIKKEQRVVEKTVQKEVQPLVYKLLEYFDGEINYTLAGYVSKILATFLTKRPAQLMKYILKEDVMHKVINHAQSRSVGQLIGKVLTHESTHLLEPRKIFFKELLNRTSIPASVEVISNLSSYVCEIVQKVASNLKTGSKIAQLNDVFFSLETVSQVIKNVVSQQQSVAVYNAPILLTYLTNVPFILPQDPTLLEQFMKLGSLFFEKSCQKLKVEKRERPKLGLGRIKLIEILRFVVKQNILNCKEIVATSDDFFPLLIKLIREYDMNNVLHNEIIKIIEMALTEPEGGLLKTAILKDRVLLNFIVEECQQDAKIKAGDSLYKSRKGFIAHVINLCVRLKELGETSPSIKALTQSNSSQFSNNYSGFVEKEIFNSKKSLAGLMKKEQKHQIMFQREDIIASHMTFLTKCPAPIFEVEPQPENIENPDLVEELQRQLEDSLTVGDKKKGQSNSKETESTSKVSEESENKETVKEKEQVEEEGNYWATHLEYNIDDLMADL